jgi:hypothetical protein
LTFLKPSGDTTIGVQKDSKGFPKSNLSTHSRSATSSPVSFEEENTFESSSVFKVMPSHEDVTANAGAIGNRKVLSPDRPSNHPHVESHSPKKQLIKLVKRTKDQARSRMNFAWRLMPLIFQPSEMEGRNCSGWKKEALDGDKLDELKQLVLDYYPVEKKSDEKDAWRECKLAIDKGLRTPKSAKN